MVVFIISGFEAFRNGLSNIFSAVSERVRVLSLFVRCFYAVLFCYFSYIFFCISLCPVNSQGTDIRLKSSSCDVAVDFKYPNAVEYPFEGKWYEKALKKKFVTDNHENFTKIVVFHPSDTEFKTFVLTSRKILVVPLGSRSGTLHVPSTALDDVD